MYTSYLKILLVIVLSTFALHTQAQSFKQINIEIAQDSINELESHPFTNEDVHGNFVVDGQRFTNIELHYRGAYYLLSLIQRGSLRNWKVKFPKSNRFENRREWNFNYEDYIRQNLAYHIFREAGVPAVSSENVILSVNGQRQGLYLKYEDPDNKRWLTDVFGDNDGDLYKAAFDMPNQTKYFADLTYLGPNDSDYFLHYRKQTNKNGASEFDYSSIREFTEFINHTSKAQFEQQVLDKFDVVEFIEYLVVSNFISNWDSYPYRPKNFFLYDNPDDRKWHYIPWDLDGTFQSGGNRNPIGLTGSIFHYFDGRDPYNHTPTEPLDRPLVWRIMDIPQFRDKYCFEYKKAIDTYLDPVYLNGVIDSIALTVTNNTSGWELRNFDADVSKTKNFIAQRMTNVRAQLAQCVVVNDPLSIASSAIEKLTVYPNPASHEVTLKLPKTIQGKVQVQLVDVMGKQVKSILVNGVVDHRIRMDTGEIPRGQYFIIIRASGEVFTKKLLIANN